MTAERTAPIGVLRVSWVAACDIVRLIRMMGSIPPRNVRERLGLTADALPPLATAASPVNERRAVDAENFGPGTADFTGRFQPRRRSVSDKDGYFIDIAVAVLLFIRRLLRIFEHTEIIYVTCKLPG